MKKLPKKSINNIIKVFLAIVLFFTVSYLIFKISPPNKIVTILLNYKFLIPLISVFGSNILTGAFLYPFLILLKQQGMNIFFLVFLASIGSFTGDMVFYYFGDYTKKQVKGRSKKILDFFESKKNSFFIGFFIFLYAGFFPLSNEFMTLALGYFKFPKRKMFLPLFLGNLVYYFILLNVLEKIIELIF
ncbi:MAG TPA: hypothetical protein VJ912_00030 [Candidatus Nanoarchaeia archaeon]|nr:hypothetical protein [Candidatus Nanoarchaeia archaeon]